MQRYMRSNGHHLSVCKRMANSIALIAKGPTSLRGPSLSNLVQAVRGTRREKIISHISPVYTTSHLNQRPSKVDSQSVLWVVVRIKDGSSGPELVTDITGIASPDHGPSRTLTYRRCSRIGAITFQDHCNSHIPGRTSRDHVVRRKAVRRRVPALQGSEGSRSRRNDLYWSGSRLPGYEVRVQKH